MGKHNSKGRSKTPGKFVMLPDWLTRTPAYRCLTPAARSLYVEFNILYNGVNNGELFVSWREAAKAIGVRASTTAAKALEELTDKGFIKQRVRGSFGNKTGLASTWVLTAHDYRGKPATKEFASWRPTTQKDKKRVEYSQPAWLKKRTPGEKTETAIGDNGMEISLRPLATTTAGVVSNCSTSSIPSTPANDGVELAAQEASAA